MDKRLFSFLLLPVLLLPQSVLAVSQDQLWLPRDYYRFFNSLHQAAEISEQTERCQYVIAGTLSQERSSKRHPVFVITCRDQERQTFAYIVDGLSLEILNRPPPPDPVTLAQQQQQLELEKKWQACEQQIKQRARGLRGLAWLSQQMPEAIIDSEGNIEFHMGFNASGSLGEALRYLAICEYQGNKKLVEIHARVDEPVE